MRAKPHSVVSAPRADDERKSVPDIKNISELEIRRLAAHIARNKQMADQAERQSRQL
jgi:hypothetical protein